MMSVNATGDLPRLRARFVRISAIASLISTGAALPFSLIADLEQGVVTVQSLSLLAMVILNGLWLVLLNRNQQRLAEVGLTITFTIAAVAIPGPYLLLATLALTSAGLLSSLEIYLLVNVVVLGKLALEIGQTAAANGRLLAVDTSDEAAMLGALLIVSVVTRFVLRSAQQSVVNTRRTASLLQTSAEINRITSRLLDMNRMLEQAVSLLRTRLGYDHVQAYLLREGEGMTLTAASSNAGRALLGGDYHVPLGSLNAIGQVALTGNAIIRNLLDTAAPAGEDVFADVRSRVVLPMRDGERVIGALDLQSAQAQAFLQADVQALQVMADLLATSVRNARLYEEQARTAEENKRLYEQADANLREIGRLNQQLMRAGWQEYIGSTAHLPGVTVSQERLIPEADWTEALTQAQQEGRAVNVSKGSQPVVAVPITLRGEVIGAIEVEPGAQNSDVEAIEMVEAVAQRLAISLENARLYEETQVAAAQEQRINDIAARYQQVTTVDELLRVTLQELSKTLGAERGVIRLGNAQEMNS